MPIILIRKIKNNRIYDRVTAILFPIIIVLYSFIKVNKGLDITDSAYSCNNFLYLNQLDGMWYYSTFYANLLGRLFTFLPWGYTFIGLNFYTGLVKLLMAISAYFFFVKSVGVKKELSFAGILASVGLCWCPTTILYNYLSYLLFFWGAMLIYIALVREKSILLLVSGFILGSNFFVRLPNVLEVTLIFAVWYYSFINKESIGEVLKKTGFCVGGYTLAAIPGLLLIIFTRGFNAYTRGIKELFGMTEDSTSYSAYSMVYSIAEQYVKTLKWIGCTLLVIYASFLIFVFGKKVANSLKFAIVTVLTFSLGVFFYKAGMFNLDFTWFGPVYRYGALILFISIILYFIILLDRNADKNRKLLAIIGIILIAIAPLGSNNDIYSNLNFMFWVLPLDLFLIMKFEGNAEIIYGVRWSVTLVIGGFCFLSLIFGASYIFRDGLDAKMDTYVTNNSSMVGMKTTHDNATRLSELTDVWVENSLDESTVLLYGNVCGIGFYMNTPMAISTAWPSLLSFSTQKFEIDMGELEKRINNGEAYPSVVIGEEDYLEMEGDEPNRKQEILNEFLDKYGYIVLYSNDVLTVLTCK